MDVLGLDGLADNTPEEANALITIFQDLEKKEPLKKQLKEAQDAIISGRYTEGFRQHLIKNSGFSPTTRVVLTILNGGINLNEIGYSSHNSDYGTFIAAINTARVRLGRLPIESKAAQIETPRQVVHVIDTRE